MIWEKGLIDGNSNVDKIIVDGFHVIHEREILAGKV